MDNKELVEKLKGNQAALQALMRSRDGQALMQRLTHVTTVALKKLFVSAY